MCVQSDLQMRSVNTSRVRRNHYIHQEDAFPAAPFILFYFNKLCAHVT